MRRHLTAAAGSLALVATAIVGAAPAQADTEPADTPSSADAAQAEPLPELAADAAGGIDDALAEAEGTVTAFVEFDHDSALDVVDGGGSPAEAAQQATEIEEIAEELVPDASGFRAQGTQPERVAVTSNLIAGTIVVGEADQVRNLADSDDVASITLVPLVEPSNSGTNLFTRAQQVWEYYGETGEGITIGIIDTGVDYTHAAFGGPGTAEAYAEAYGADGTGEVPEHLIDPAKFLGGWDFAGHDYDASGTIPGGTTIPQPDANPIDAHFTGENSGHGTHVAGTAAGYGVTADGETFRGDYAEVGDTGDWLVGPGSAPEAGVYALKVFGDIGGSTALTIEALDWAADPNGDGDFNDRLDVINLSLGSSGSPVDNPQNRFVDRLTDLGTLTVASAGNSGDLVSVSGSPGSARSALSVANSVGETIVFDGVEVTAAADESLLGLHPGQFTVFYAGDDTVEAPVVYLGDGVDGCTSLTEYASQVAGNVVWLHWEDDGAVRNCGSGVMWANATAVGAAGVLIGTEQEIFSAGIAGDAVTPGLQLTAGATDALLPEIQAGTLEVRIDTEALRAAVPVTDPDLADLINTSSSRGQHGSLEIVKPDVSAPGTRIASASAGAATAAHALSGTSMSAPHVAGIAALVRATNPGWSPDQVKASIVNTATNPVYAQSGQTGPIYGPDRVGAGRVDALAAVSSGVIAYDASDRERVSAIFGVVDVGAEPVEIQRTVRVQNISGPAQARYTASFEAATTAGGATIDVTPSSITVPRGQSRTVTLTLRVDPETLAREIDPTQNPMSGAGVPRDFITSLSGQLVLASGGDDTLHVPVHAAPRPTSDLSAETVLLDPASGSGALEISGRHLASDGWTSFVSALELTATSPQLEPVPGADTSPSQVAAGDIRLVGATSTAPRLEALGVDPALGYLGIGITTHGEWPRLGLGTIPVIDIDLDGDGVADLQTAVQRFNADNDVTVAATFDLSTGDAVSLQAVNGLWGDVDSTVFDNNVLIAPIPLSLFEPGSTPEFTVWTFSAFAPTGDNVVDVAEPFTYDPFAPAVWTEGGSPNALWAPSSTGLTVHAEDADAELLVLHSHNSYGSRAEVVDLELGEIVAEATTTTLEVTGETADGPVLDGLVLDGPVLDGDVLTLSAEVAPAEATGAVVFLDGETELAEVELDAGSASTEVTAATGTHEFAATFVPDSLFWAGSTSETVTVEVLPAEPEGTSTTTLRLDRSSGTYGDVIVANVTVNATAGSPSGTVEIRSGSRTLASGELEVDGTRGTVRIEVPGDLPPGLNRLTAVYEGSAQVSGSTSPHVFYIVSAARSSVTASADLSGSVPAIEVSVRGRDGAPAPSGQVTITGLGTRAVTATLDENGRVRVEAPNLPRIAVVSVVYGGDSGHEPSRTSIVVRR